MYFANFTEIMLGKIQTCSLSVKHKMYLTSSGTASHAYIGLKTDGVCVFCGKQRADLVLLGLTHMQIPHPLLQDNSKIL